MRSHIDDIIALADKVLGPDDGGPVPTTSEMGGRPTCGPLPGLPVRRLSPSSRIPVARGPVGVHALKNMTFEDLEQFLGAKPERTLAHNTSIFRYADGNTIGIKLHNTVIFCFWREPGSVDVPRGWAFSLNSGGYETTTTKQRMNALLPPGFRVYSEKFYWYVSTPAGVRSFRDGMTFEVTA